MLFDSSNIPEVKAKTSDLDWFLDNLDPKFQIPSDQDLVIFGFNDIGKTTLVKVFKNLPVNSAYYLNYEDDMADFADNVSGKDKIVTMGVNIAKISQIKTQKEGEKKAYKDLLKNWLKEKSGISNKDIASGFNQKVIDAQAAKTISKLSSPIENIKTISSSLVNIPARVFCDCKGYLDKAVIIKDEVKSLEDEHFVRALTELDHVVLPGDSICPVCGQPFPKIKDKIDSLIKTYGTVCDSLAT